MTDPLSRLLRFLSELKRRKVYRVAVSYAVVGFVLIEAADLMLVRLGLPSWTVTFVIVLVAVGFPLALILAWAFDLTPEGVRRTSAAEDEPAEPSGGGTAGWMAALVVLLLAGGGFWYLTAGSGGEPAGETAATTHPARTGSAARERSIAVLPFEALGQEEVGPFTEGMHDALLTRLSNVSGLTVISRQSVQQYRGSEKTTAEIARELGVKWIVEGGVQEMGDQIQVNAQLIDSHTDAHAWAESYRRDLEAEDLFALQSDITKRIARSLEAELTPQETERVEHQPTEDLDAYRLYVQGRTHMDRRTEEGLRRGEEHFRRTLERDSTYALAWAGLADARSLLGSYGYGPRDSLLREARDAVERALELDPELAEAHASLGLILMDLRQDGPGALRELRRAVELKPSYARAYHWMAALLSTLGRHEEARGPLRRAAELDPTSLPIHVALSFWYYYADSLQRALEEARRTRQLFPGYPVGSFYEGSILSALGRQEEAIAALRRVLEQTDPGPQVRNEARARLAVVHMRAGDTARARTMLEQLEERKAEFEAGLVRAGMGGHEAALSRFTRARHDHGASIVLRYEPILDPLRDDPRFQELIREINRAWGLNPDGSLPDSVDVSFEAGSDG